MKKTQEVTNKKYIITNLNSSLAERNSQILVLKQSAKDKDSCLVSRNNEIDELKKQVLQLSEENASLESLRNQAPSNDKQLSQLNKQIEDQKKKIDSQASTQAGIYKKYMALREQHTKLENRAETATKSYNETDEK